MAQNGDPLKDVIAESERITDAAARARVTLKLMGGAAIRRRSPSASRVPLSRKYGDLDFATLSKQRRQVQELFPSLGYEAEERFNLLHVEHALPQDVEEAELPDDDPVHLPALIRDHFGVSSSEARRLLAQGGVKLDGETLGPDDLYLPTDRLDGAVLQLGKRRHNRFRKRKNGAT